MTRLNEILKDPKLMEAICLWDENRHKSNQTSEAHQIISQHENCEVFKEAIKQLNALDWLERPDFPEDNNELPSTGNHQPSFSIQSGSTPMEGYTLLSRIGKGSFGEVWKAIGPGGFSLAVKVIPMQDGLNLIEIRALELFREIRHPHLISIFGFWIAKGYLWIAMELAECNLLEYLKANSDSKIVHELFEDAAQAIDYLNQGLRIFTSSQKISILHRDIKPQNMLIVGGKLKLGDFGLARILDSHKNEHSGCLTTTYSAPEFFKGAMAATSDQYSLAISYCKIRGGRVPFVGNSTEVMAGHCGAKPDLSMLPKSEQFAVSKALSKKPESRWKSCTEFIQEIKNPQSAYSDFPNYVSKSKLALVSLLGFAMVLSLLLWSPSLTRPSPKHNQTSGYSETILQGHLKGEVTCLALSTDEKFAMTGGEDKQVIVWDLNSKKSIHFLKGHDEKIAAVSISPDNTQGLSSGAYPDTKIIHWDLKTGLKLKELTGHKHGIRAIKFLPDGVRAVSASMDCTARLWDLKDGKQIHFFESLDTFDPNNLISGAPKQIWAMGISKDGKKMVSCLRNGKIYLHEVETGKLIRELIGPDQYYRGFSMNDEGTIAYTSFGGSSSTLRDPDLSILKWNLETAEKETLFKAESVVECLCISRDGMHLHGFQRQGGGLLWDEHKKSLTPCFDQLNGNVRAVIEDKLGSYLYVACKDATFRVFGLKAESYPDK